MTTTTATEEPSEVHYRMRLVRVSDYDTPDEWGNTDVYLVAKAGRYLDINPPKGCPEDNRELKNLGYTVFALRAYIHSGVALSLGTGYPFNDLWDSCNAGYVAVHQKVLDEASKEWRETYHAGKTDKEIMRAIAEGLVETWNRALGGDVWAYIIERVKRCSLGHEHVEEVDSTWGIYGEDEARKLGEEMLKHFQEKG